MGKSASDPGFFVGYAVFMIFLMKYDVQIIFAVSSGTSSFSIFLFVKKYTTLQMFEYTRESEFSFKILPVKVKFYSKLISTNKKTCITARDVYYFQFLCSSF